MIDQEQNDVNLDDINAAFQKLTKRLAALEEPILVPESKEVHRTQLKLFMESRNGVFLGIDFTKLDGSDRKLLGRLGRLGV